jgi:hypothetical protein
VNLAICSHSAACLRNASAISRGSCNVTTRFHHVSFPQTLGIGVDADITAVTLK